MKLNAGLHLTCSTNDPRIETWAETFQTLKLYAIPLRERLAPARSFGLGLRLTHRAAHELSDRATLLEFQRWLGKNHCYVFTVNGASFGRFHSHRLKEQIYEPDWTSPERVTYTNLLVDLLAQLVPAGVDGSVNTLPGSFKGFYLHADEIKMVRQNLWRCVEHVARVSAQTGRPLHLALEPEPLCLLESSGEILQFFDRFRIEHPRDERLAEHLGINYNTCHFAVEFEEPANALACLIYHSIKISKIQLSAALTLRPTPDSLQALRSLPDDGFLHQVVVCRSDGQRFIYADLRDAFAGEAAEPVEAAPAPESDPNNPSPLTPEWRVHCHVPLHSPPQPLFNRTADHVLDTLDLLASSEVPCSQLEIEQGMCSVLPEGSTDWDPIENVAAEYDWTLRQLADRGLLVNTGSRAAG
jgi:hypothetical protein